MIVNLLIKKCLFTQFYLRKFEQEKCWSSGRRYKCFPIPLVRKKSSCFLEILNKNPASAKTAEISNVLTYVRRFTCSSSTYFFNTSKFLVNFFVCLSSFEELFMKIFTVFVPTQMTNSIRLLQKFQCRYMALKSRKILFDTKAFMKLVIRNEHGSIFHWMRDIFNGFRVP